MVVICRKEMAFPHSTTSLCQSDRLQLNIKLSPSTPEASMDQLVERQGRGGSLTHTLFPSISGKNERKEGRRDFP